LIGLSQEDFETFGDSQSRNYNCFQNPPFPTHTFVMSVFYCFYRKEEEEEEGHAKIRIMNTI
jgi:hypothetical protein